MPVSGFTTCPGIIHVSTYDQFEWQTRRDCHCIWFVLLAPCPLFIRECVSLPTPSSTSTALTNLLTRSFSLSLSLYLSFTNNHSRSDSHTRYTFTHMHTHSHTLNHSQTTHTFTHTHIPFQIQISKIIRSHVYTHTDTQTHNHTYTVSLSLSLSLSLTHTHKRVWSCRYAQSAPQLFDKDDGDTTEKHIGAKTTAIHHKNISLPWPRLSHISPYIYSSLILAALHTQIYSLTHSLTYTHSSTHKRSKTLTFTTHIDKHTVSLYLSISHCLSFSPKQNLPN